MADHPRVAVVILGWNGKEYLEKFLPSVVQSTYPNLGIVVADNDSSDGSLDFVKEHFPSITTIQNGANLGFAAGYNAALEQVQADYFILLNQDVEVTPGWIEPVIESMEKSENIGAAQPKLRAYHEPDSFEYAGGAGGLIDNLGYPFCRGRIFDEIEQDYGQYDEEVDIFWASGAALFIRAELYRKMDGLDPSLFAHMEEIDLCWRIKRAGYRILGVPTSVVYHVGGGSLPMGHPKKAFLNFRNNLVIILKNEKGSRLWWLLPLRLLLDWIAAARELMTGKPRGFGAILKAHWQLVTRFGKWYRGRTGAHRVIHRHLIGGNDEKGRYRGAIIVDFFLKGRKRCSDLPTSKFN